jgi:competence protein ComGC
MMKDARLKQPGPFRLLKDQRGITLIEAMVLVLVIVVLVLSIYIGVVYAEKQLLTNYRDRVAMLLVAGELEMEYLRHSRSQPFELQKNKEYVIDDLNREKVLTGRMNVDLKRGQESSNEQLLDFIYLEATLTWRDPYTKSNRFIRLREDYFL